MKKELVWLSKLKISNMVKAKIIKDLGGLYNFYNCSLDDLVYLNLNDNLINKILNSNLKKSAEKDLEYMYKNNIDIIGEKDVYYPNNLKLINDRPLALYIRGDKKVLSNNAIGIVGSRNAYRESLNFAKEISKKFSERNINIISGLARGIDKYAHLGCLDNLNGGKTIAVLGSGIDDKSFYPLENRRVFERIIVEGGAIISEYPLFTEPYAYNFPYRNRIISGLSNRIIVVQASRKSGSLITVDYALEQGKDVYVYKDKNINEESFSGNKLLIEQGANIINFPS